MTPSRLFVLNAVIAGFYGIVLLAVTGPILDIYGIDANADGVYMARWFGLGLIATGLTTWLTRDAADAATGRAIAQALGITYGIGVVLAMWGTVFGPFNVLGCRRDRPESVAWSGLRLVRVRRTEDPSHHRVLRLFPARQRTRPGRGPSQRPIACGLPSR